MTRVSRWVAVLGLAGTALAAPTTAVASPVCWKGPAVVRDARWYLADRPYVHTASRSYVYGRPGDVPFFGAWAPGHFGNLPGVVRGRTWYLRNTEDAGPADITFTYGRLGDVPVVGDWNNDGLDTPGVVRGTTWYLRNRNNGGPADVTFTWSVPGIPSVYESFNEGPYPATFDNGTWYVKQSFGGSGGQDFTEQFGAAGDVPVGGGFYRAAPDCTSPSFAVVRGNVWHLGRDGFQSDFAYGRTGDKFLYQH